MFKYENCKNGKQYGNHYESISTHLRLFVNKNVNWDSENFRIDEIIYRKSIKEIDDLIYFSEHKQECADYHWNLPYQGYIKEYNGDKNISFENKPLSYPVITEVKDYALRMLLIRHARQVVADSIRRKQEKEKLHALWEE